MSPRKQYCSVSARNLRAWEFSKPVNKFALGDAFFAVFACPNLCTGTHAQADDCMFNVCALCLLLSSDESNRPTTATVYAVPMAVEHTPEPSQSTGVPAYGEPLTTATVPDGAPAYSEPLTTAYVAGEARQGDQTYIYVRPRAIGGKCFVFCHMHTFMAVANKLLCCTSLFAARDIQNGRRSHPLARAIQIRSKRMCLVYAVRVVLLCKSRAAATGCCCQLP